jgi:hypothetical protein
MKAKLEKQRLLDEEEKQLETAMLNKAQKGALTGKKAKQYDAMEAQKKALMKSMQMMMANVAPEEEGDDGAAGLIEEIVE